MSERQENSGCTATGEKKTHRRCHRQGAPHFVKRRLGIGYGLVVFRLLGIVSPRTDLWELEGGLEWEGKRREGDTNRTTQWTNPLYERSSAFSGGTRLFDWIHRNSHLQRECLQELGHIRQRSVSLAWMCLDEYKSPGRHWKHCGGSSVAQYGRHPRHSPLDHVL